jgi:hypothetical protein
MSFHCLGKDVEDVIISYFDLQMLIEFSASNVYFNHKIFPQRQKYLIALLRHSFANRMDFDMLCAKLIETQSFIAGRYIHRSLQSRLQRRGIPWHLDIVSFQSLDAWHACMLADGFHSSTPKGTSFNTFHKQIMHMTTFGMERFSEPLTVNLFRKYHVENWSYFDGQKVKIEKYFLLEQNLKKVNP